MSPAVPAPDQTPSEARVTVTPMSYGARILADSLSRDDHRLTTFEVTFPRIVLAEFNTHRVFSRNSASSRAIPVVNQLRRVLEDPYVPGEFGTNQPGMQAGPALAGPGADAARAEWLSARDSAVAHVIRLISNADFCPAPANLAQTVEELGEAIASGALPEAWLNVHKQLANRLLEPFMWQTVIVTATEWSNFWNLRAHQDAQPEIQRVASLMREAWNQSEPDRLRDDEWHLPLMGSNGGHPDDELLPHEMRLKVAVGRCARVSYLTHSGRRDAQADVTLHDRLVESGHLSPFEHVARPMSAEELSKGEWCGNLRGWRAYRKDLPGEADPLAPMRAADPSGLLTPA